MLLLSTRKTRKQSLFFLLLSGCAAGVSFCKDNFKLIPENLIEGRNGHNRSYEGRFYEGICLGIRADVVNPDSQTQS
ncbi:uncharacterized protein OCT59_005870 [Rhizophagus irregularis]|uniref:uncharacterized protein n=1 Tax=Rhizophagus irregularis TaxID=588596 RepID=UPI00332F3E02|nr:hypothetical protein OCT59_005870 [Rhizophagus irregularis]